MKRNRNFLRYFSIFALGALFMLSCEDENESFLPLQINADSNELVNMVNTHRKKGAMCGSKEKAPAKAIELDESLCLAALRHANDMQQNDYFNHKGQDGSTFSQRAQSAGYEGSPLGENIAYGYPSEQAVIDAWMKSSGHCNNIMNAKATEFGIAKSEEGNYWVMILGKK